MLRYFIYMENIKKKVRKNYINVRFDLFGMHNWPKPNIERVDFLKYPHTHVFKFRVKIEVDHTDRDVEFFDVKEKIMSNLIKSYEKAKLTNCVDFGSSSCEKLATEILDFVQNTLKINGVEAEVFEDGNDSAVVECY